MDERKKGKEVKSKHLTFARDFPQNAVSWTSAIPARRRLAEPMFNRSLSPTIPPYVWDARLLNR